MMKRRRRQRFLLRSKTQIKDLLAPVETGDQGSDGESRESHHLDRKRKPHFPSASKNKHSNANETRKKGRKKLRGASKCQWVGSKPNTGGRQNSSAIEGLPNMHYNLISFLGTKNRKKGLKRKGREVNQQLLAPLSWGK